MLVRLFEEGASGRVGKRASDNVGRYLLVVPEVVVTFRGMGKRQIDLVSWLRLPFSFCNLDLLNKTPMIHDAISSGTATFAIHHGHAACPFSTQQTLLTPTPAPHTPLSPPLPFSSNCYALPITTATYLEHRSRYHTRHLSSFSAIGISTLTEFVGPPPSLSILLLFLFRAIACPSCRPFPDQKLYLPHRSYVPRLHHNLPPTQPNPTQPFRMNKSTSSPLSTFQCKRRSPTHLQNPSLYASL